MKFQSGETRVLRFNADKVQLTEDEFDRKKFKRVYYCVLDPKMALEGASRAFPKEVDKSIPVYV